jgi:serine/threonine-protein kinase
MLRGRPLAGLVLAGVVFAAAYLGGRSLDASRSERIADHAVREAQESARLARDALAVQLESVKMMVHNAVVNPRLVVVLRGRVDAATLKDALTSESWWEPFREAITAISYEGEEVAFQQGGQQPDSVWNALPLVELIRSVRATGARAVQLSAAGGRVYALAAIAMPVGEAEPPVVVMAKPVDAPMLTALNYGGQTPVLLSNGRRSLGGWGSARDVRLLEANVGREAEGVVALQDTAWGAAARELTPGLWLWTGSRVTDFASEQLAEASAQKRLLWGGASALAVIFVIASLLPRRRIWDDMPRDRAQEGERAAEVVPLTPAPVPAPRPAAAAPSSPGLGIGTPLGRYVLLDRIGEGGMAEVFTAVSFGSGGFRRTFVVKRLRPEMASNPVAVAHFIDEANLASTLVHPNIVPVFDFGEVGGSYFLAQEYVVGRDVGRLGRRMLEQNVPRLTVSAALYIVHEMLRGLHHAHEKRGDDGNPLELVHRDITPENVMISERGEVKLLDFGIVKAIQRVSQTDIGTVKGNVDYMSPEQARGRVVDRRSDIFSAGLVLYFSLMRTPLYQGDTLYDRLMRAALGPGEEDQQRIAALPAPLPEILRRALAIDPEERFQTAAEFAQALAPYTEGGQAEVASVVELLFGDELQLEQDRLAAAFPRRRREDALAEESKS